MSAIARAHAARTSARQQTFVATHASSSRSCPALQACRSLAAALVGTKSARFCVSRSNDAPPPRTTPGKTSPRRARSTQAFSQESSTPMPCLGEGDRRGRRPGSSRASRIVVEGLQPAAAQRSSTSSGFPDFGEGPASTSTGRSRGRRRDWSIMASTGDIATGRHSRCRRRRRGSEGS